MVEYRTFRNPDPPGLADIWNDVFTGRGAVRLRHSSPLELGAFSKPYFDPQGIVVALEEGKAVGYAHAGFGADSAGRALDTSRGVVCLIAVKNSHRRRGIGTELLRKSETYLHSRGAQTIQVGPYAPLNPYYFGLYGGSNLPGFLTSDADNLGFMAKNRYVVIKRCQVFDRRLSVPVTIGDGRFMDLRSRYEVRIVPRAGISSWWQECVLGPIELVEFRVEEKGTAKVASRTYVWEMDGFSWRWNQPSVGIFEIETIPDLRRKGIAKFLLVHLIRYLQEQYFGIAEVQLPQTDEIGRKLFTTLGFEQVDTGLVYEKSLTS